MHPRNNRYLPLSALSGGKLNAEAKTRGIIAPRPNYDKGANSLTRAFSRSRELTLPARPEPVEGRSPMVRQAHHERRLRDLEKAL